MSHCRYCKKVLVVIGTSRKNGKSHPDWEKRSLHKKCYNLVSNCNINMCEQCGYYNIPIKNEKYCINCKEFRKKHFMNQCSQCKEYNIKGNEFKICFYCNKENRKNQFTNEYVNVNRIEFLESEENV
jgi:hypothetical protein